MDRSTNEKVFLHGFNYYYIMFVLFTAFVVALVTSPFLEETQYISLSIFSIVIVSYFFFTTEKIVISTDTFKVGKFTVNKQDIISVELEEMDLPKMGSFTNFKLNSTERTIGGYNLSFYWKAKELEKVIENWCYTNGINVIRKNKESKF